MSQDEVLYSVVKEQEILGEVLGYASCADDAISILYNIELFFVPKHQKIWKAVLSLHESNEPVDITTVSERLLSNRDLESVGGRLYLVELIEGVISSANAEEHARIVREKGERRLLRRDLVDLVSDIDKPEKSLSELVSDAEGVVAKVGQNGAKDGPVTPADVVDGVVKTFDDYQNGTDPVGRVYVGFGTVDKILRIMPGNLLLIAGWSSQGKTQLGLQIAVHNILKRNKKVAYFSLEMTADELTERIVLNKARLKIQDVMAGKMSSSDWDDIQRGREFARGLGLRIYDKAESLSEIRSAVKREVSREGVDLVIVDHAQLVTFAKAPDRRLEVAEIGRSLKLLAQRLGIPIVLLSQLTDLPVGAPLRRPTLRDISESKSLKNDANSVIFVWNDPSQGWKIRVEKQRNGPTGTMYMSFVDGRWEERDNKEVADMLSEMAQARNMKRTGR